MNDKSIGMSTTKETRMVEKLTAYLYILASLNVNVSNQYKLHLKNYDNNWLHKKT